MPPFYATLCGHNWLKTTINLLVTYTLISKYPRLMHMDSILY